MDCDSPGVECFILSKGPALNATDNSSRLSDERSAEEALAPTKPLRPVTAARASQAKPRPMNQVMVSSRWACRMITLSNRLAKHHAWANTAKPSRTARLAAAGRNQLGAWRFSQSLGSPFERSCGSVSSVPRSRLHFASEDPIGPCGITQNDWDQKQHADQQKQL